MGKSGGKVGFIGVGHMGGPMAVNLVKAGFDVKVFDLSRELMQAVVGQGAQAASDALDVVSDVDVVITMLPAGPHVRSVYLDTVLKSANPSTLLLDCSTIDVATAREVAAAAADKGFAMLDAPVSGGVAGAEAGSLTFMVGGTDKAYEKARPYLEVMGGNLVHCGGAGNGQAAKICNNMMLGIQMISVSEAFVLAEKLGLDHQKLFDVSSTASGQCWSLTSYCPVPGPVPASPANRDYQPGFAAAMMLKDLRLSQEAAEKSGVATELGRHAADLYTRFAESGHELTDFSGIINMIREQGEKP